MSVERAEGPTQTRDGESSAESGTNRILRESVIAGEVCGTYPRGERKPWERFETIIDKERRQATGGMLRSGEHGAPGAVVENGPEGLVVRLIEAVYARLKVVLRRIRREAGLASGIVGAAILTGCDRRIR